MGQIISHLEADREVRVVLVGRTGTGKSAFGNTILGNREFKSMAAGESVTVNCDYGRCPLGDKTAVVIDTPGLFDTSKTNDVILHEVSMCMLMAAPGAHAVCIVMRAERLTEEYQETVRLIIKLFGEQVYKYMIVVFTGLDNLQTDGVSEKHFRNHLPASIDALVKKCNERCLFVNNRAPRTAKKDFFEKVRVLVQENKLKTKSTLYSEDLQQNLKGVILKPGSIDDVESYRKQVVARRIPYEARVNKWVGDRLGN